MDLYLHVRAVISILVGFSLTRLVSAAGNWPSMKESESTRFTWFGVCLCSFTRLVFGGGSISWQPIRVDLSSLRISHRLWRANLFRVCSAFSQRSELLRRI